MGTVSTNDISGYAAYLKAQGVPDSDIHGYTQYLAEQHGVEHPSEEHGPGWIQKAAGYLATGAKAIDSVTGAPTRSAIYAAQNGQNPVSAAWDQFANMDKEAPTGQDIAAKAGFSTRENPPMMSKFGRLPANPSTSELVGDAIDVGANPLNFAGPIAKGVGSVAGKVGEVAAPVTDALTSTVPKWAAKKIGKILVSVPEETTARYINDPSIINNALPREDIADKILSYKNHAEDALKEATDNLANAKSDLTNSKTDVRAGLQDQKFSTSQKLQSAQDAFNEKKQVFKEALKNSSLTNMASDVNQAIGDLKSKVTSGSKEAYTTLFQANGDVQTKPLINLLQNHVDSMLVNGVPASQSASQAINEINAMQERIGQMGEKISMPQAKQILQGLDKDINYSKTAGSFAPQSDQALSDMRSYLDQEVKRKVPAYREKMAEVSRQTRLLKAADELYGDPEKAIRSLNNISSETGQAVHVPLIEALGKETGKNLSHPVNDFLAKQKILTTPSLFEQMIEDLPEAKGLRQAQSEMAQIQDPQYSRDVLKKANMPLAEKINQAKSSRDLAKNDADLFKGVSSNNITSKTKALGGANKYGAEATFEPIDQRFGTDFQKQIQARNDLDQFLKTDVQGSRKTVLGGAIGAGLGYLTHGTEGAAIGATAGAQAGSAIDKYGGVLFKKALDKGIGVGNRIDALRNADLTGAAEAAGKAGNAARILPAVTSGGSKTADELPPSKGPDKWANDGFQKLKSHSDQDTQDFLNKYKEAMLVDPKAKQLLMSASNFSPGSKPLDQIMKHLKNRFEKDEK